MERDGDRAPGSETDYVRMFNSFITRGSMTATYKAVFLRCLLDLGHYEVHGPNRGLPGSEWIEVDGDTVTLDLNFVAARFIKYYWDMDHSFRLKQTTNPTRARIVQIVRRRRRAGKFRNPPALGELVSGEHAGMRQDAIVSVIKKQVLNYLPSDMPRLCRRIPRSNKIRLDAALIPFLKRHRVIIRNGLNHKLAVKLESLNKTIPQIAAKIDEESYPSRSLHVRAAQVIDSEQQSRCFYCDAPYREKKERHIDHVIPFNYIFSTDMYNCVAACPACNLQKHDCLPAPDLFSSVMERNDDLEKRLGSLPRVVRRCFADYDGLWYKRTYEVCRIEYHGEAPYFSP